MFILWFSLLLGAEANILSLKSWCHEIASKIARKNACWYTHKMYLPSKQEKTHHSNTLTQNDRPTTVLYKWISLDFIFHFSLFFCRLLFSLCSAPFHSGLRPKNFALKNEIHSWIFLDWKYFRKKHPNGIGYFRPATAKKSSNKYEKNRREKKKNKGTNSEREKKSSKCGSYCLICWHFSYGFDEVNMIHFCMCIFSLRKSMWILYSISSYFWDFYVNQLLGRKELWTMVVWKWPKTIEWNSHWISVCIKKTTRSSSSKEIELLLSQRLYFGHWFVMMNNSQN